MEGLVNLEAAVPRSAAGVRELTLGELERRAGARLTRDNIEEFAKFADVFWDRPGHFFDTSGP